MGVTTVKANPLFGLLIFGIHAICQHGNGC